MESALKSLVLDVKKYFLLKSWNLCQSALKMNFRKLYGIAVNQNTVKRLSKKIIKFITLAWGKISYVVLSRNIFFLICAWAPSYQLIILLESVTFLTEKKKTWESKNGILGITWGSGEINFTRFFKDQIKVLVNLDW